MLEKPPRLWVGLVLGFVAGWIWAAGRLVDDQVLRMVLVGGMVATGGGAGFCLLDWAAYRLLHYLRMARELEAITPEMRTLQVIQQMRPEALQMVMWTMPRAAVIPGAPGPKLSLVLGEVDVPFEFVFQFLNLGDGDFLCTIRTWAEGSAQREWAMVMTNFFVMAGYAEGAKGNRPARWLNRQGAMEAIGLEGWEGNELITEDFVGRFLEKRLETRIKADENG